MLSRNAVGMTTAITECGEVGLHSNDLHPAKCEAVNKWRVRTPHTYGGCGGGDTLLGTDRNISDNERHKIKPSSSGYVGIISQTLVLPVLWLCPAIDSSPYYFHD